MKKLFAKLKKLMPGKTGLVVLSILLVYAVGVAAAAVIEDGRHVRFYMTGPEELELECFEPYQEPGIYAVSAGSIFGEGKNHLHVESSGNLDNSKLGEYTIKYTVRYFFREYSTERKVKVVDRISPVLELKYLEGYEASWMTGYQEEGFVATDNYDGDLTSKVESRLEDNRMVYTVTDSSGNTPPW